MNRDAYYDESVPKIKLQEEKPSFIIRSLQINETSLLRDFLYENYKYTSKILVVV